MNAPASLNLDPLEKSLRRKLEAAVKDARDVVEAGASAACTQLGVGSAKADDHLSEDEKDLRRRLRVHGRQLGDVRGSDGKQQVDRLVEEIGYQHWHRMLFARFLSENNLLMYPDPDEPVAITLEECDDLAADEGAKNGWELAAKYAARMLPQIFRVDSPVFSLSLPTESQQELEKILAELPAEVFQASDSLGWVYQFWQAKRKDEVNASEVKIGARELPAVTQLFTEPYMVSFLLDNSLGAWWAGKRLTEEDLATAETEQELRDKLALPGVPLEYLRFVRTESGNDAEGEDNNGPWTPAAGTFDAWPESLSELKTLDPCCGSGHFLVAALLMLTPMRMELEGLPAKEAVDRVLAENLHGLEIDQRCVELAAFSLALTAWRFPDGGGYRILPKLSVASSGLSISTQRDEWLALAGNRSDLRVALDELYIQFKEAPKLGSLINPKATLDADSLFELGWEELGPLVTKAVAAESAEEKYEMAAVAAGLSTATRLLSGQYHLVVTNFPYLGLEKQAEGLSKHLKKTFQIGKRDLSTSFIVRSKAWAAPGGLVAAVMPGEWTYARPYRHLRQWLLSNSDVSLIAFLGKDSFETGLRVTPTLPFIQWSQASQRHIAINVKGISRERKGESLAKSPALVIHNDSWKTQQDNRFLIENHPAPATASLEVFADARMGVGVGDVPRFERNFWEVPLLSNEWEFLQGPTSCDLAYGGKESIIFWEEEKGEITRLAESVKHLNHAAQNWQRGRPFWGKKGVMISQMGGVSTYLGDIYASRCMVIVPLEQDVWPSLVSYALSGELKTQIKRIDDGFKIASPKTILSVPFDPVRWQAEASEKYPHGLPEPYSDDTTQWLFHGHTASSTNALQVAVARLLGYQWPAELDAEMELATDARQWINQTNNLNGFVDNDGIVCIPAVGTEQPADERLLNLLHRAYEDGRKQEQIFADKLAAADEKDPVTVDLWRRGWEPSLPDSFNAWRDSLLKELGHTGKSLESWLRDKFFTQHCKLFHHRPFIWHIWDGLKDGFSALINYHKLDNKLLETLIYTYLNDWIKKQKNSSEDGSEEKLAAAEHLKVQLEKILEGELPNDIFVRWKPLEEQPIGWNPDLNDGVRMNIRPWMTVSDIKKKGAGLLRDKPNIKWGKDRGKDVESAPWYKLGPEYGGKEGDRINDHHLTLAEKTAAKQ